MTTYRGWLCFLLFTAVAWGQAAKPAAPPAPPRAATAPSVTTAAGAGAVSVGPATAVITIPGLCDKPAEDKSKTATCKTVVTRAETPAAVVNVDDDQRGIEQRRVDPVAARPLREVVKNRTFDRPARPQIAEHRRAECR